VFCFSLVCHLVALILSSPNACPGERRGGSVMGVRVQIDSLLSSAIYLTSVRGTLSVKLFHPVLLNAGSRSRRPHFLSLAASHPQDATVLSLTSFGRSPRATARVPSCPPAIVTRLSESLRPSAS
jgi:hypothetical protein